LLPAQLDGPARLLRPAAGAAPRAVARRPHPDVIRRRTAVIAPLVQRALQGRAAIDLRLNPVAPLGDTELERGYCLRCGRRQPRDFAVRVTSSRPVAPENRLRLPSGIKFMGRARRSAAAEQCQRLGAVHGQAMHVNGDQSFFRSNRSTRLRCRPLTPQHVGDQLPGQWKK
jgi:hypothetical protein